jgi:type IV secretory pathway TraG/TraD family ATPase VirD4
MNKIIILLVLFITILLFKYIEPLINKRKIKSNNEYGSARFSTFNEIKNNFREEKINKIKEVGFPIMFDKKLSKVWFDRETPHWVYLGSTGSGKSVTQVIPFCSFISIAENKRSAFITDPKGEIFSTTSKMFKDRGYKIITIDFRNPELSNKFNILEPIIKEYELYRDYEKKANETSDYDKKMVFNNKSMSSYAETNRLISSLSDMVMKDKQEAKDPFWNQSARQLLEGLIGFFLEEYKLGNIKRNQITMTSIRKFQNSSMSNINFEKFIRYLNKREYGSKSKDSLTSVITASENTYRSITSVFGSKMSIFDDVNIANVTSESDFDISSIGKEPTALYVIVPDEDKTYYVLITIIVGLLYRELTKLANVQENKKLPIQIDWLLDEFANCPPLPDIDAIVSVARSRGMRFHFFIQSFAQLNNVYGKDVAQIILDNCGLVYLKTNTQETAESISKRLGKKTIESNSLSRSLNKNDLDGKESISLMARDLLTPDEIKQLHYKMIIFPIVGYPVFRDTILFSIFSCYQSGFIERKNHPLKDLSYTYFTVEKICKNKSRNNDDIIDSDDFMNELKKSCIDRFAEIRKDIVVMLNNINYKIDYIEVNYQYYMQIKIEKKLSKYQMQSLESKYSNFKIEYLINSNSQIINIYFKN